MTVSATASCLGCRLRDAREAHVLVLVEAAHRRSSRKPFEHCGREPIGACVAHGILQGHVRQAPDMPCLREVHCLAVGEGALAHEDSCEAHVVATGDLTGFDCGAHAFQHGVELGEGHLYRTQSARLTRAVQ